jgi:hypothetical protein
MKTEKQIIEDNHPDLAFFLKTIRNDNYFIEHVTEKYEDLTFKPKQYFFGKLKDVDVIKVHDKYFDFIQNNEKILFQEQITVNDRLNPFNLHLDKLDWSNKGTSVEAFADGISNFDSIRITQDPDHDSSHCFIFNSVPLGDVISLWAKIDFAESCQMNLFQYHARTTAEQTLTNEWQYFESTMTDMHRRLYFDFRLFPNVPSILISDLKSNVRQSTNKALFQGLKITVL